MRGSSWLGLMGMCVLILVMTATVSAANDVLQPCRVMIVVD